LGDGTIKTMVLSLSMVKLKIENPVEGRGDRTINVMPGGAENNPVALGDTAATTLLNDEEDANGGTSGPKTATGTT
jgi:hypothetical protein